MQGALGSVRFQRTVDSIARLLHCVANFARDILNNRARDQLVYGQGSLVERPLERGLLTFAGRQHAAALGAKMRLRTVLSLTTGAMGSHQITSYNPNRNCNTTRPS